MSVLFVCIWTTFLHPRLFDAFGDVVGIEDVIEVEVHVDRNWRLFLELRIWAFKEKSRIELTSYFKFSISQFGIGLALNATFKDS